MSLMSPAPDGGHRLPDPAALRSAPVAYNKDQWISSFEDQLSILRPHLTPRVLTTMSLAAWHEFGRKDAEPIKAARDWSKSLDKAGAAGSPKQ